MQNLIGSKEPEWTATAYVGGDRKTVSSKDYQGKWHVLYWYPEDFTFVCPTEIVGFQKLTPLLPDAPAGWTADKPEGSTMNTPQMQISQASRRYQKGNASMKLTIMDGMAAAASGLAMLAGVSEESSKGFRKPYSAGGLLGSEEWTAASKHVDIQLLTKKRFLIGFDGTGLDGVEVGERMIAKLDPAKLDALAQ